MTKIFEERSLDYEIAIRARFGTTVVQLVKQGMGMAVIDRFTIGDDLDTDDRVAVIPIDADTSFETYVAVRKDLEFSGFAERFVSLLREEMNGKKAR